jgi:hypothetical protein
MDIFSVSFEHDILFYEDIQNHILRFLLDEWNKK